MKIVVLDGYTLNPGDISWGGLKDIGELTVYDRTPSDKIVERIGDAAIVFTNKTPLTEDTLARVPKLKYIGVLATGYNVVDVRAAGSRGIVVTNIPAYGTDAVAQFTFALLLEVCHHVGAHDRAVKTGAWTACPDFCFWNYPLIELAGKIMGVIGFGRIGRSVARIALAFGMKVLAYDEKWDGELESANLRYADLDALLENSDVVSLHCPLTESTKGIIDRRALGRMKDTAILVNTSRGPLVAESDLADALNNGTIAGAAMDVVSVEPIAAGNPLLGAKNCIITPHIAWAPKESRERLMDIAVENLKAFLGGAPVNVV